MIKRLALGYVKDKIQDICKIRESIDQELFISPKYKDTLDYAVKDLRISLDDLKVEVVVVLFNLSESYEIDCYRRIKNDY